jgi:2-haloacid dehalogenase
MRNDAITAVAFDAYGTLFDVFSVTTLCEQLFPGTGRALAHLWRTKQLQYSVWRSLMERYEDFWRVTEDGLVYASESLQLDLTAAKRAQLMAAYLNLAAFPDVRPGLEALKHSGFKLAILSNGAPKMLGAVTKNAGIDTLFDAIVSADEVRVFKPSPAVYRAVAERLAVQMDALAFVSSNAWDVSGAASAGLTAFWLQRAAGEPPEELGYAATRVVSSLPELAERLARS